MKKRFFLSQPMANKTEEEILAQREAMKAFAKKLMESNYFDGVRDYEIIDSYFEDFKTSEGVNVPLAYLSKSLTLLAGADIALFAPGYNKARGCKMEYDACISYNIDRFCLSEKDLEPYYNIDKSDYPYYAGTKLIQANPKKKDGKDGYEVVYPDGYVSWSPKNVFEKSYMEVEVNQSTNAITVSQHMVDRFISSYFTNTHGHTTIVKAILKNGFEIVESSTCVDPANYDEKIGEEICLEKIKDKVWELLGFLLCSAKNGNNNLYAYFYGTSFENISETISETKAINESVTNLKPFNYVPTDIKESLNTESLNTKLAGIETCINCIENGGNTHICSTDNCPNSNTSATAVKKESVTYTY